MKKILITLTALLALAFTAQSAQAALVTSEIKVNAYGKGMLIAPGIECGSGKTDCSETVTWDNSGPAPELSLHPQATAAGWSITSWGGCQRLVSMNDCRVSFPASGTRTVLAYFFDIQAPSVFISGYTPYASQTNWVNLNVSDNEKLTKVEFLVDDEVVLTQTENFGDAEIDVSGIPDGDHVLKVRAVDGNQNVGQSQAHTFNVDHTPVGIVFDDPLEITNSETPSFEFSTVGDDLWSVSCLVRKQGEAGQRQPCDEDEPFVGTVNSDGVWEFVVGATDRAGNESESIHRFRVDRTAPSADFTAGPQEGATLEAGQVEFGWTASDENRFGEACVWDGSEPVACEGTSARNVAPGDHEFKVTVTDEAGNATTISRTFHVKATEVVDPDPDPDPDPNPDTTDRIAPAIKLVAPKQTVRSMRKALKLRVRCDEACAGKVVVRGKRGIRFTGRVYLMGAGVAKLKLRPTAKVRKWLTRAAVRNLRSLKPRRMNLTARASLRDRAGNTGKSALKFSVGA